jgi:hypothetical protein
MIEGYVRDTAFEVTVRKMGMSQVRRACEPEKVDDFSGKACHGISVCAQGVKQEEQQNDVSICILPSFKPALN